VQYHLFPAGIDHDGDVVRGAEYVHQHGESGFEQFELVDGRHGARYVYQENIVGRGKPVVGDGFPLDAEAHEQMSFVPRTCCDFMGKCDVVSCGGFRTVEREIVEELFDSDCGSRRILSVVEPSAHVAVGGAVAVYREGRHGSLRCVYERIFPVVGVSVTRTEGPLAGGRFRRESPGTVVVLFQTACSRCQRCDYGQGREQRA
jgi:hypothetical protein